MRSVLLSGFLMTILTVCAAAQTTMPADASSSPGLSRLKLKSEKWIVGQVTRQGENGITVFDLRTGEEQALSAGEIAEGPSVITDKEAVTAVGVPAVMAWRLRPALGKGADAKSVVVLSSEKNSDAAGERAAKLIDNMTQGLNQQKVKVIDRGALGADTTASPTQEVLAAARRAGAAVVVMVAVGPMEPPMERFNGARWRALDSQTGEVLFVHTQRLPGIAGGAGETPPPTAGAQPSRNVPLYDRTFKMTDEKAIKSLWKIDGAWSVTDAGLVLAQAPGQRGATGSIVTNTAFRGNLLMGIGIYLDPGTYADLTLWGATVTFKHSEKQGRLMVGIVRRDGDTLRISIDDETSTLKIAEAKRDIDTTLSIVGHIHQNYPTSRVRVQEIRIQGQTAPPAGP